MAERNKMNRAYSFTLHVPDEADYLEPNDLKTRIELLQQNPGFKYLVISQEICPTTSRKHYQGYINWRQPHRWKASLKHLTETFPDLCHPFQEVSGGDALQNRKYCLKLDTPTPNEVWWEFGQLPKPGSRTDLAAIVTAVASGMPLLDIANNYPTEYLKYHGGIKSYQLLTSSKPRTGHVDPTVHWLFGPTGVGKSRRVFEQYGNNAYWKMMDKWWDGYLGQDVVVFDDYRANLCFFHELLRIVDRYPYRVQPKGGSIELSATTFVFTTTSRPEVIWHTKTGEQIDQLLRRISTIEEILPDGSSKIHKDAETPYTPLTTEELSILFPPTPQPNYTF